MKYSDMNAKGSVLPVVLLTASFALFISGCNESSGSGSNSGSGDNSGASVVVLDGLVSNSPLASAEVIAFNRDGEEVSRRNYTDSTGRFSLELPEHGEYRLETRGGLVASPLSGAPSVYQGRLTGWCDSRSAVSNGCLLSPFSTAIAQFVQEYNFNPADGRAHMAQRYGLYSDPFGDDIYGINTGPFNRDAAREALDGGAGLAEWVGALVSHAATGSGSVPPGIGDSSGSQPTTPTPPSDPGGPGSGGGQGIVEWTSGDGQTERVDTALRRDYIGIYETQHTHNSIPHFRVTLFANGELTLCWREVSQNTWSSVDSATTRERGSAFAGIREWAPVVDSDGQVATRTINNPDFPQAHRLAIRSDNGDLSVNELLHARVSGGSNFSEALRPFARQAMFAVHKIADTPPSTVVPCAAQ